MKNRTSPLFLLLCILIGACAKQERDTYIDDSDMKIQFEFPTLWVVQEVSKPEGLIVYSPKVDAGMPATVTLAVRLQRPHTTFEQVLKEILTVRNTFQQFELKESQTTRHTSGNPMAQFTYSRIKNGKKLMTREIIISLGDGRILFVSATSAASRWKKYQSDFKMIFDSLRPLEGKPAPVSPSTCR